MSLRAVDLNLVPVLQMLLRERSVSRAAENLGLSQSATSAALGRLRLTLEDPLLVRVGGRLELTPRAVTLLGPLEALCDSLEGFFSRQNFDPLKEERTFIIASSDYATLLITPSWLTALARAAPKVRLRFVDINDQLPSALAARDVDFALLPSFLLEDLAPAPLRYRPLLRDRPVAMFRDDHPLDGLSVINRADLARFQMISLHPGSGPMEEKRSRAFLGGQLFEVAAFVPQVTLPPFLILETDYFAILPERLAIQMTGLLPLQMRPLGFQSEKVEIGLAWSPVQDADPAHRWFRAVVEAATRSALPQ